ncbi:MAG: hypothetical protein WAW69_08020 [Polaromonas sp.]
MHFIATAQCPRVMPDTLISDPAAENPNSQTQHCSGHPIIRLTN